MACRLKNLHKAVRLPGIPCLRIAANASSRLRSGCLAIKASSQSACFSSGDVLPPRGFAAALRLSRQRCSHLTAALALISKCSAASRREPPLSTRAITRWRNSVEYGFGMVRPLKSESLPTDSSINKALGILRFYSAGTCSRACSVESNHSPLHVMAGLLFRPSTSLPLAQPQRRGFPRGYDVEGVMQFERNTLMVS